ncbi:MAG TPA: MsnO8 family LLM class oxidoreductase [Buttiauxella sp.]|jgi:luciferase family oxidoreductase group 1
MSYRISLLDKSPVAKNETPALALQHTLSLAQQAESWGYHRFWIAEHHNTSRLASPSPELLIAWILGQTHRIRVGSGGVMLQHYSPYKVAENFNLLASLAPGRVDLGVGKAPGGLPLSTRALQSGLHQNEKGTFADQLAQLDNWLSLPAVQDEDADGDQTLRASPVPQVSAERFLLGASRESALLAAQLDWEFVFAAHLNGDKALLGEVLNLWQQHSQRDTLVAVQVIVAHSAAAADELASQVEIWSVELENDQRVSVGSEAQAHAFARQTGSPIRHIQRREPSLLKGTAETVHAGLDALQQEFGIDEFIIDTPIADFQARTLSLRLLADVRPASPANAFLAEHEAW